MEAYGAAAGAPLRAAGASPSSVTETAIWKHSFFGTPLALHEVISSCRKTSFEEIDGKKQAKDTLLGLLFHKLRSCGIAARKAGARRAMNSEGCGLCSSGHLVIVRSVRLSVFQIRSTAKQMLRFISRLPV